MKINFLSTQNVFNTRSNGKNHLQATKPSSKISFASSDTFDYEKELEKKLKAIPWYADLFGEGTRDAEKTILERFIGIQISQNSVIRAKEATIEAKNEALRLKQEALDAKDKQIELLQNQIEYLKRNKIQSTKIDELTKQVKNLLTENESLRNENKVELARYNKTISEQSVLAKREKGKGWDKYAGHELIKKQLQELFINKIPQEKFFKDTNIFPNGILFYGQHGTGKTYLFKAFAEQSQCEPVEIDMTQTPEDILDDLYKELKSSRKRFDKEGKRTLILLDDFNAIAELSEDEKDAILENGKEEFSSTNAGQLAEYLDDTASKYKATIIMTTNHPANINSEILSANRVPYKIFLGPPTQQDIAALFKFYLEGNSNVDIDNIDFIDIAQDASKAIKDSTAYSAQGIVNIVNRCNDNAKNKNTKITQNDIKEAIREIKPDISKKEFTKFLNDLQYLINDGDF